MTDPNTEAPDIAGLVEELRSADQYQDQVHGSPLFAEAADALEALQAARDGLEAERDCFRYQCNTFRSESVAHLKENARLREALESAIYEVSHLSAPRDGDTHYRPIIKREVVDGWRHKLAREHPDIGTTPTQENG